MLGGGIISITDDNVPTAYWSCLEIYVSIICCCLPALRSLLQHVLPSCFGGSSADVDSGENRGATPYTIGSMPKKQRYAGSGIQKSVSATVTFEPRHTGDGASDVELIDRGLERDWSDAGSKGKTEHAA